MFLKKSFCIVLAKLETKGFLRPVGRVEFVALLRGIIGFCWVLGLWVYPKPLDPVTPNPKP